MIRMAPTRLCFAFTGEPMFPNQFSGTSLNNPLFMAFIMHKSRPLTMGDNHLMFTDGGAWALANAMEREIQDIQNRETKMKHAATIRKNRMIAGGYCPGCEGVASQCECLESVNGDIDPKP